MSEELGSAYLGHECNNQNAVFDAVSKAITPLV
jgi:hypothetical protein